MVRARALVNAAGPWAGDVARLASAAAPAVSVPKLKLVKGSHIVVPRIAGAEDAYLLQNGDDRVVFALPFETDFTLIGTTDVAYVGRSVERGHQRRGGGLSARAGGPLLCQAAHARRHRVALRRRAAAARRRQRQSLRRLARLSSGSRRRADLPPLLNVIGGKITTYRRLAEAVLAKLEPHLAMGAAWTAAAPLPGGDVGEAGIQRLSARSGAPPPGPLDAVPRASRPSLWDADRRAPRRRPQPGDLGADLGGGLTEREVGYLREREWAQTPDDVLWRRTKAGLHMTAEERAPRNGADCAPSLSPMGSDDEAPRRTWPAARTAALLPR